MTTAIPPFQLGHPPVTPMLPFGASDDRGRLTAKYRPRGLSDVLGQPRAVGRLSGYATAPYPHAFLLDGPTGVGKSSAALALGEALGCHPTVGRWEIKAGETDAATLEAMVKDFRYAPMGGGWRIVIVEEADYLASCPKAALMWLSILDDIPARTTVVFTSNHSDKFPDRFKDRVERITFEADWGACAADTQALADRIMMAECGRPAPPIAELGCDPGSPISFRRIVQRLESHRRPMPAARYRTVSSTPGRSALLLAR